MTTHAHDLAFGDLGLELSERYAFRDQQRDMTALPAEVVELQDEGIVRTAVAAWMLGQVAVDELTGPLTTSPARRTGLISM